MKVKFRTFCQGCRYGISHRLPIGSRSIQSCRRDLCVWSTHRFEWEYWIEQDGIRLVQRRGFASREMAQVSAGRKWSELTTALRGAA